MIRKDLIVAIVIIFCLTAALLLIVPIRSIGDQTKNENLSNRQLHNYTDAKEYTIWEESRLVNGTEHGVYVTSCGGPFAFSPKQNFIAVTDFVYIIQAYKEGIGWRLYPFTFDVNEVTVGQNALEVKDCYPTYAGANITLAGNHIHPGINNVHFQFQEYVFVLKISVWVEYVYQD